MYLIKILQRFTQIQKKPLMRWNQTTIKNDKLKEKIINFNLKCSGEYCCYTTVKNKL